MKVVSKIVGGYRQGGGVLLRKGDNVLDEPLTPREREFIDTMVKARLVKVVDEFAGEVIPEPPISTTKLGTSTRVDVPADVPASVPRMKVRRAKKTSKAKRRAG